LELPRHEGCAPEDADEGGRHREDGDASVEQQPVVGGEEVVDVVVVLGEVGQVGPGDCEADTGRGDEGAQGDELQPELPPGQPDHRITSSAGPAGVCDAAPSM